MRDFLDYIFDQELDQLLEGVESYQPLDGKWDQDGSTYRFNVSGDGCDTCPCTQGTDGVGRCYSLEITDYGGDRGVSIAFYRGGSTSDMRKNVGMDVFKGVLKGLSEYISAHKPASIRWSAVRKSSVNPLTRTIVNPEARAHVYEGWAVRHLFPEKYVGMQGKWIRRDIYDKEYVSTGYPPVPEGLTDASNPGEKKQALESMKEKAQANQAEIQRREIERQEAESRRQQEEENRRREEIRRQREEAQQRRLERLRQELEDPEKNPNGIQLDDVVYLQNPDDYNDYDYANRVGKVIQFMHGDRYEGDSDNLSAQVQWSSSEDENVFDGGTRWFHVTRLKKETPEGKAEREKRRQEKLEVALSDPEKNPNGVREGDDIITHMADNPHSSQHGLLGKIKKITLNRYGIAAYVDWDDHAKEVLGYRHDSAINGLGYLKKATPEEIQRTRQARRQFDIDQEIELNRQRHSRPRGPEIEPADESLINHPGNPLHLKPGDHIIYNGYVTRRRYGSDSNGHKGYIVSIRQNHWDENRIEAEIRLHGSTARRPITVWNITALQRDESPESQAILARQQAQQQRQQRLTGATNGHNIGDTVRVVSGIHRGKSGRIVSFRMSGQNALAVIAQLEGPNINVRISALQPPANTPAPAAESFSFRDYLTYMESRIVA